MLLAQAATKLGMRVVDDMGAAAGDGELLLRFQAPLHIRLLCRLLSASGI